MPASRLSPLPPDLALHLSPSSVRLLLTRFAASSLSDPSSPLSALDPTDRFAVVETLCYRAIPAPLADALALLTRLATAIGRDAILELLASLSSSPDAALPFHRFPPAALATRILCARGIPPRRARAIVKRALIRVGRHFSPRPWYTLLWPRRELPSSPDLLLAAARVVHGANFLRAWVAGVTDGVLRVIVLHRAPAECSVSSPPDNAAPTTTPRARITRPYACDVLRWDSRDGRVSFSLARPALLTDWAFAIGDACAGDPHAFSEQPAYTHKSLHEKGAAWLASVPLPAGVSKLDVIACEVDLDGGKRVRVRSDGALDYLHKLTGRARGNMRGTTLRFLPAGHDELVDATIDLPWKVLLSDGRFEEELRLTMDAIETHAPGSLPDDLPSLAPVQPEWRWIDLLTAASFARALENKTLTRVRGKRPSGREHGRWGSLLRAFDMAGEDAAYVVGEEMAIRAFDAKPESLVWYEIDWKRVAEVLRSAMGFTETRVTDAPAALLPIGEITGPRASVVVFTLVRAVGDADVVPLLKQLRLACGRATPALLVPRGRSLGGAIAEVEISAGEQLGVEDLRPVAARLAEACGLESDLEPSRFATAATPLVLSVSRNEAWYGRVRLLLTENQLAMLFVLARAGTWMKGPELGRKIAPSADHPDQTVRKARLTLAEKLVSSWKAAGLPMPEALDRGIISFSRSKGYRLCVGAVVV